MKSFEKIARDVESEAGPEICAFLATFSIDLVANTDPRTLVTPRRTQFSISDVGALDIKNPTLFFLRYFIKKVRFRSKNVPFINVLGTETLESAENVQTCTILEL